MSRLRKIAQIPAGSQTKWVVAGFWLLMLVILFPLSAKRRSRRRGHRDAEVGCAGIGTSGRAGGTPWWAGKAPAGTAAT